MAKLTEYEKEVVRKIYSMSREEMAYMWRFSPVGHSYFNASLPFAKHFKRRFFKQLGGFSPEISKSIGWG